jgi:hypothetical protein
MKLCKSVILILSVLLISCKNDSEKTSNEPINNVLSEENEKKHPVKDSVNLKDIKIDVHGLKIGDLMPERIEGYQLISSMKIVDEGSEEPVIKVMEDGNEVFQLKFAYDDVHEKFTNKIGEIFIFSPKFKTQEHIGVHSTIEEFIAVYSTYYLGYSYISNHFIIKNEDPKIQFILDEKNYIGQENLYEHDWVALKKEDFMKISRIKEIRIF